MGTEEITRFGNVIHETSDLASYSESRRTGIPATLSDSKVSWKERLHAREPYGLNDNQAG
ncbi:MAG: hypothetical protein Q8S05_00250 [Sulfuricella sp.]|nr:hypothetical protein [Sulfuricella sp.]